MAVSVDHEEVLQDTKFYLGRPLGGGRPVPPSRSERRKPSMSTLLGIENFPGESKCGAGVEVQLRARHSYASFFKAWLLSLVSIRGRCWPVGVLILYLIYLVGTVTALKSLDEEDLDDESLFKYSEIPVNELGVALFFLLGFRTNCSYQHWWQGRMEWGMIQARSLNMARESVTYVDDLEMRKSFLKWNAALIVAMKAHLREERDISELQRDELLSEAEVKELVKESDMVVACFLKLSELVYTTMNEKLTRQPQLILQLGRDNLKVLAESFCRADAIRVTPLPYAYVVHLRLFLVVWLLALPLAYTVHIGWWAILAAFLIGVALLGFDSIATKIENPYGCGFNDIPLDAIVKRSKAIIQDCMDVQSCATMA